MTPKQHEDEHNLIADAFKEDWNSMKTLLVHLATAHGYCTKDVANTGSAVLLIYHDQVHGRRVFEDIEDSFPTGLQEGLSCMRDINAARDANTSPHN